MKKMPKILLKGVAGILNILGVIAGIGVIGSHIYLTIMATLYFIARLGLIGILLLFIFGPAAPLFPFVYWIIEGVFPMSYFMIVGVELLSLVLGMVFYGAYGAIVDKEK